MRSFHERVRLLSEADREVYETTAERYETRWGQPGEEEPDIASFLPAEEPIRTLLLVHLAKCDMDFRLQRGEPRRLEDYLARFPELAADPAAQLELLLWEYRLTRGAGAKPEDLARRFPGLAEEFRAAAGELEPPKPWVPPAEYEIEEPPVGRGGWGVVYRARHRRLGRVEALKVVDPQLGSGHRGRDIRAQLERLRREILVAALLKHPNIIHLYGDGESNGYPYFVMEYCAGGNLKERLAGRPLPSIEAAALVRTLAEAIDSVHASLGLVHRDLKPTNVLFGERDVPKIADFGLALPLAKEENAPALREIAGSPAYMAPEQADPSRGSIGPATDVYGLGAVLYECLTGHPPFTGVDSSDVLGRVLRDCPEAPRKLNPSVPLDLEAVCLKCLRKDPQSRYHTARDLSEDLSRFLDAAPVRARPQPRLRLAWHWVRTNRWKVIIAAALVVVAATFFKFRSDARERDLQVANARRERAEQLADAQAEARRQAEGREAVERLTAHAARVTAARQSARSGDWITALGEFDRAIRDGETDSLRLRVERLVGYFALNQATDLTSELDALSQLELGELSAQVKLVRAAWLLCDFARQEEGRKLAREALESRQHLFSPADVALAEALATEQVGQAIAALRRAVEADPLHYLAAGSLAVALAVVGDRDEAVREARFLRGVFPLSPMPDVVGAVVALTDGDRKGLKEKLAQMAEKLPENRRAGLARLEEFLLVISELQEISIRLSAGEPFDASRGRELLEKAIKVGGLPTPEPLGLPVPAFSLMYQRLLDISSAYLEVGLAVKLGVVPAGVLRRLEALNKDYPDAGVLLLTAVVHVRMAVAPLNRGDIANARKHLQAAAELTSRVGRAPNIVPRSPVRYLARGLGVLADLGVLKLIRRPERVHLQRVRASLHLLVSEGEDWKKLRQPLIGLFVQLLTAPLTREQCVDWNLNDPPGQEAFDRRRHDLAALTRALLDDWAIDEPDNPAIPGLREDLAKWVASSGIVEEKKPAPKK